jgi:predicted translin family RNA/ssDNA-binding protein
MTDDEKLIEASRDLRRMCKDLIESSQRDKADRLAEARAVERLPDDPADQMPSPPPADPAS